MNEKEILFQMLDRYINNLVVQFVPSFSAFSPAISRFVKNAIEPYVDAFMMGTNSINTEAAGEFLKTEMNEKIDTFIKQFNNKRDAL